MEGKLEIPDHEDEEETPDHFLCCICLELLYKPVVLPCGHMACFWCDHVAMNRLGNSHCPICRNSYNYFPAICLTLHFMLKKLYPLAYNIREEQTLAKEKESSLFSPQFQSYVLTEGVGSNEKDHKDDKEFSIRDVTCNGCLQMLFRPVILNCGHAFCLACIPPRVDGGLRCSTCQSHHPDPHLKVCLELDQFLETRFPQEYSLMRDTRPTQHQPLQPAKCEKAACAEFDVNNLPHIGVGCDSCGMYPIVGERYKCKDCVEVAGFDLCGECYKTRSKLPGRFNQNHKADHSFKKIESFTPLVYIARYSS